MIKHTLYPKTKRIGSGTTIQITEKLDGSNIGFFKWNGELYVAQRNYIFKATERGQGLYKGLAGYLDENADKMQDALHEDACIFCEWMGMGRLKYPGLGRVQMFAKANVSGDALDTVTLKNIYYQQDLFKWSFVEQEVPSFISVVPLVGVGCEYPSVPYLDMLYGTYCEEMGRDVEGFIILANGSITKYVRKKNGTTTPHKE